MDGGIGGQIGMTPFANYPHVGCLYVPAPAAAYAAGGPDDQVTNQHADRMVGFPGDHAGDEVLLHMFR